jgi:hypothetical protein
VRADVEAVYEDPFGGWPDQRADAADRRALAGAVGPEEAEELPLDREGTRTASIGGDLRLPGYVFTRFSTTRMLMARGSPHPLDAVLREDRVRRDDREPVLECLGHEQPIERVAVMERQSGHPGVVLQVDG